MLSDTLGVMADTITFSGGLRELCELPESKITGGLASSLGGSGTLKVNLIQ